MEGGDGGLQREEGEVLKVQLAVGPEGVSRALLGAELALVDEAELGERTLAVVLVRFG